MAAKPKRDKFYMGNTNVPFKGAEFEYTPEMVSELEKCKKDILYFAENYFYVLNIDEGRQKIKLHPFQKRVLKAILKNRFFVLLASRQVGKSTIFTVFILWLALFNADQRILLVANKEATAIEIFGRVRMAYEMLPNWLKVPVVEYAKTSMELENNSRISISTTTGTAARGQAVSCVSGESIVTVYDKELDISYDISMKELTDIVKNNGEIHTILLDNE